MKTDWREYFENAKQPAMNDGISTEHCPSIEEMRFQAFKARLIEEIGLDGQIWDGSRLFDGKLYDKSSC